MGKEFPFWRKAKQKVLGKEAPLHEQLRTLRGEQLTTVLLNQAAQEDEHMDQSEEKKTAVRTTVWNAMQEYQNTLQESVITAEHPENDILASCEFLLQMINQEYFGSTALVYFDQKEPAMVLKAGAKLTEKAELK